ncbi:MAG: plastocyanin/azurin family copper-binding protein [Halodesulfurarchaeum sp.]|nr:plastocyanin/azurin family copper-binding protein [Halodesulfurarchaeum sp.]
MKRRQYVRSIGGLVGIGMLAGCSGGGSNDDESEEAGPTVDMVTDGGEYYFDPIGLFVEPGTTVTFNNHSGSHSATAYVDGLEEAETTRIPDGGPEFNTGILTQEGATETVTFDTEGTYDYYCIPHKTLEMVGRIVVGSPGGPAEGSMPPDGDVPDSSTIVDSESISYTEFQG